MWECFFPKEFRRGDKRCGGFSSAMNFHMAARSPRCRNPSQIHIDLVSAAMACSPRDRETNSESRRPCGHGWVDPKNNFQPGNPYARKEKRSQQDADRRGLTKAGFAI